MKKSIIVGIVIGLAFGLAASLVAQTLPPSQMLMTSVTGILPVANGGTGSAAGNFSGPYAPDQTVMVCGGADFSRSSFAWARWGVPQAQTDSGTRSAQTCIDTSGPGPSNCVEYLTAASTGSIAGLTFNVAEVNVQGWRASYEIITDATTSRRIWVTMQTAAVGSRAPPTGSTSYSSAKYVGAAVDSAVNGGKWLAVSADGANESGTDTGVAGTATKTRVDIDCFNCNGGSPSFRVGVGTGGGAMTYTTKSSNMPTSSNFGTAVYVETRANVAAKIHFLGYSICSYM